MMKYPRVMIRAGRYLDERFKRNLIVLVFFAMALAVRIFVYFHTAIINPDGPLYIFQARSLFTMDWEVMTKCGLSYVSVYPFLIYLSHLVFDNWDTAAQMVSLFFGTALLVPIYLLLREFFSKPVCQCTTLAFSLIPIMVCTSVDVVRDPVAWFFLATGQLMVVLAFRRGRRMFLLLALAAFALAIWARIEAFVYILATAVALPMISWRERWRNLGWFLGPLLVAALLTLLVFLAGMGDGDFYRFHEILMRADPLDSYEKLRVELAGILAEHQTYTPGNFFILEAKRFAWLIAWAGVLNRFCEAFSYGFSLLFLLGLWRFRSRFASERLRPYFLALCGFSLLLLYAFMVQSWVMEYRYTVLVIVGGVVIFAVGVEWLLELLGRYLKPSGALLVTAGLLFLSVSPKIFQGRAVSEVVFKEIGLAAAALSSGPEPILIMSSGEHLRLLTHYANSHQAVAQCPEPFFSTYESFTGDAPGELAGYLRTNRIGFFLWEENNLSVNEGLFREGIATANFTEAGQWDNPQTGRMTLYRLL